MNDCIRGAERGGCGYSDGHVLENIHENRPRRPLRIGEDLWVAHAGALQVHALVVPFCTHADNQCVGENPGALEAFYQYDDQ